MDDLSIELTIKFPDDGSTAKWTVEKVMQHLEILRERGEIVDYNISASGDRVNLE